MWTVCWVIPCQIDSIYETPLRPYDSGCQGYVRRGESIWKRKHTKDLSLIYVCGLSLRRILMEKHGSYMEHRRELVQLLNVAHKRNKSTALQNYYFPLFQCAGVPSLSNSPGSPVRVHFLFHQIKSPSSGRFRPTNFLSEKLKLWIHKLQHFFL